MKRQRLNAYYLSTDSQNEFIGLSSAQVFPAMLEEHKLAKYFFVVVDATPES